MIPFLNRHEQVARCLGELIRQGNPQTLFLLIDDGSQPSALDSDVLQPFLHQKNVHLIGHEKNCGVSAARNSGLDWCRRRGIEIVIMMDSDCRPGENLITGHLALHRLHEAATCIGGSIIGEGRGLWAKLDGIVSWIHASAHGVQDDLAQEFRYVAHPYHLASTNFSLKLKRLPLREFIFDERLVTGEDCLLVRELRKLKHGIYFSSTPRAYHQDRENWRKVFAHHYEWGHHQYFIQLGGDISSRCFHPLYRLAFVLVFLPSLPFFALLGSLFNSRALWGNQRKDLWVYPLIYLLWLGKGCAVVEAAIRPQSCLRTGRQRLSYRIQSAHE